MVLNLVFNISGSWFFIVMVFFHCSCFLFWCIYPDVYSYHQRAHFYLFSCKQNEFFSLNTVKEIEHDVDNQADECYIAMDALCEVQSLYKFDVYNILFLFIILFSFLLWIFFDICVFPPSQVSQGLEPLIVYFSDSSQWLSRAVPKSNRKEFVQKLHDIFSKLSGPVVLICGQNKIESGSKEKEKFVSLFWSCKNAAHLHMFYLLLCLCFVFICWCLCFFSSKNNLVWPVFISNSGSADNDTSKLWASCQAGNSDLCSFYSTISDMICCKC